MVTADVQNLEERVLSPQCFGGQHEGCKHQISFVGEDGVGRTMVCPCRCHDRAPESKSAVDDAPDMLYVISWEYEVSQEQADGKKLTAWIKRKVLTISKEIAGDWIDGVAELAKTNRVRNLDALRAPFGKLEKIV